MGMFCFQCQETVRNSGCTMKGVCGKQETEADLMDLLIYVLKGISIYYEMNRDLGGMPDKDTGRFLVKALFVTITNVNFDEDALVNYINEAFAARDREREKFLEAFKKKNGKEFDGDLHDSAVWYSKDRDELKRKSLDVGVLSTENEDVRSLRETLIIGTKGLSAYTEHAAVLGYEDTDIYNFVAEALASTTKNLSQDEMTGLVLRAGDTAVKAMALLDKANTETYGNPEVTEVNIGTGKNPGILVSGHDLKDMEEILKQTEGSGVDVYTHGEMLPAHYYPAFKKYKHLAGNYGNSWWLQDKEFESFNGPIIMTTNCLIPVKDTYRDRLFTTGVVGYPGIKHIPEREEGKSKDFSEVIEMAKKCQPPKEIESGKIVGGFAHAQVTALADKIVEAVKSGAIKKFVVMAGCDGRFKSREYFTEIAKTLPKDAVILTAGCAKYRYNKLDLGDIGGIPRVIDAGQCNDSYSLAVIALKLKDIFGADDVNDLPIAFDVAWYEQKAAAVLLALLALGFKGVRIGPTLPAFLSPNVAKVLVDKFDLQLTGEVDSDVEKIMSGK